jgi:hypothetical protein
LGVLFKHKKTQQKNVFCGPHLFSTALRTGAVHIRAKGKYLKHKKTQQKLLLEIRGFTYTHNLKAVFLVIEKPIFFRIFSVRWAAFLSVGLLFSGFFSGARSR